MLHWKLNVASFQSTNGAPLSLAADLRGSRGFVPKLEGGAAAAFPLGKGGPSGTQLRAAAFPKAKVLWWDLQRASTAAPSKDSRGRWPVPSRVASCCLGCSDRPVALETHSSARFPAQTANACASATNNGEGNQGQPPSNSASEEPTRPPYPKSALPGHAPTRLRTKNVLAPTRCSLSQR